MKLIFVFRKQGDVNNSESFAFEDYKGFIPNVGDRITYAGYDGVVKSRELDLDNMDEMWVILNY